MNKILVQVASKLLLLNKLQHIYDPMLLGQTEVEQAIVFKWILHTLEL